MENTRKRAAPESQSNEPISKKQNFDCISFEEQVRDLQRENEEIRAAADRNSVKMGKVLRQNRDYLEKLGEMKKDLDKERQEADKWQQKFMKLNQDFENYRRNKREDLTTIADRIKSRKDRKCRKNDQPSKLTIELKRHLTRKKSNFEVMQSMTDANTESRQGRGCKKTDQPSEIELKSRLAQQKQEFEAMQSMINAHVENSANERITSIWYYLQRKKNLVDTRLHQLLWQAVITEQ